MLIHFINIVFYKFFANTLCNIGCKNVIFIGFNLYIIKIKPAAVPCTRCKSDIIYRRCQSFCLNTLCSVYRDTHNSVTIHLRNKRIPGILRIFCSIVIPCRHSIKFKSAVIHNQLSIISKEYFQCVSASCCISFLIEIVCRINLCTYSEFFVIACFVSKICNHFLLSKIIYHRRYIFSAVSFTCFRSAVTCPRFL